MYICWYINCLLYVHSFSLISNMSIILASFLKFLEQLFHKSLYQNDKILCPRAWTRRLTHFSRVSHRNLWWVYYIENKVSSVIKSFSLASAFIFICSYLFSFCVIDPFSSLLAISPASLLASLAKSRSLTSLGDTGTMLNASLSSFIWAQPTCKATNKYIKDVSWYSINNQGREKSTLPDEWFACRTSCNSETCNAFLLFLPCPWKAG